MDETLPQTALARSAGSLACHPASRAEAPAPAEEEHHVSKAEAKELFRSIDDILQFASERTGLPILHSVKKKLATREEVSKYIEARLKEQGTGERFDRSSVSLKKLGLLPRDFNLREYMLGLYKEQVEGWYDAHSKTVYLLDWVAPDVQKPVMAHELVHALQDQSYDLDKWLNVHKDSKDDTVQMVLDEQRTARQSIVEGQAMIVLFDYQLKPAGQTVESAPALVDSMKSSMLDEGSTPMYAKAPIYLREAMLFPYTYGMEFVRDILVKRGKQAAFAGVLDNPPLDTHQIMEPAAYLDREPQTQVKVVRRSKKFSVPIGCATISPASAKSTSASSFASGAARRSPRSSHLPGVAATTWRSPTRSLPKTRRSRSPWSSASPLRLRPTSSPAVYQTELPQRYKSVQPASVPRISGRPKKAKSTSTSMAPRSSRSNRSPPRDAAKIHDAACPGSKETVRDFTRNIALQHLRYNQLFRSLLFRTRRRLHWHRQRSASLVAAAFIP